MEHLKIPKNYESALSLHDTQVGIKTVKDFFQRLLAERLNLLRVSAPLFVDPASGMNDDLNGVERPVSFGIKEQNEYEAQVVQSLAKWKRYALKKYGFCEGEGLYTDMSAIRRDEITDNIHSIYVDQWDWEKIISEENRTLDHLKETVKKIMRALTETQQQLCSVFENLEPFIHEEVSFITSQELEDLYPLLTPKEREYEFTKAHRTACIMQIGDKLKSGIPHDGRAPDYDDWSLNCDILIYYPIIDQAVEISSMGIRVDSMSLLSQLEKSNCMDRIALPFHKALLAGDLPLTMGGGIGQSRICLLLLNKAHIGEVQAGAWPTPMVEKCRRHNIILL